MNWLNQIWNKSPYNCSILFVMFECIVSCLERTYCFGTEIIFSCGSFTNNDKLSKHLVIYLKRENFLVFFHTIFILLTNSCIVCIHNSMPTKFRQILNNTNITTLAIMWQKEKLKSTKRNDSVLQRISENLFSNLYQQSTQVCMCIGVELRHE